MSKKLFRVGPIILSLVALMSVSFITLVSAEDASPHNWLTANDYFVSSASLPANQVPYSKGTDCELGSITDPLTTKVHAGCAVNTSIGMIIDSVYTDGENGFGRVSQLFLPSVGGDQLMYNGSGVVGYRGGLKKSNLHYGSEIYTYTASVDFGVRHLATDKYQIGMGPDIAFSNNGKWMVAIVSDKTVGGTGIMLFDTESYTGRMIAYNALAPEDTSLGLPNLAVSDDGKYVASGYSYRLNGVSKMRGLRVYDTTTCGDMYGVKLNSDRKDCAYKNLWTGAKSGPGLYSEVAAGAGVLGQMSGSPIRPLNVRFKDDQTITFSAVHDFVDNTNFQASSYTISLTPPVLADETINLMALGDSYISGEGAEHMVGGDDVSHYVLGTNTSNNKCHNSDLSYPYLLGAKYADTFHSVACSGAKTKDITDDTTSYENQLIPSTTQDNYSLSEQQYIIDEYVLGTLNQNKFIQKYKPNTIILSIGGNDIGFADIVTKCVLSPMGNPCYRNRSERMSLLKMVYGKHEVLASTYQKILSSAQSDTRLYVVGYPQVVAREGSCGANVHLDDQEREFAVGFIDEINRTIKNAAESVGAIYVDNSGSLIGHRLCDNHDDGVNGLTAGDDKTVPVYIKTGLFWSYRGNYGLGNESYHPTAFGHQLIAATIGRQTEGLKKPASSPTGSGRLAATGNELFIVQGRPDQEKIRKMNLKHISESKVVSPGQKVQVDIGSNVPQGKSYQVVLHSEEKVLKDEAVREEGLDTIDVEIPEIEPGIHTLHIYTTDESGEEIDVTQNIFVAASEQDVDGDGLPNETDPEVFINETGVISPPETTDPDAGENRNETVLTDEIVVAPHSDMTTTPLPNVYGNIQTTVTPVSGLVEAAKWAQTFSLAQGERTADGVVSQTDSSKRVLGAVKVRSDQTESKKVIPTPVARAKTTPETRAAKQTPWQWALFLPMILAVIYLVRKRSQR